MGKDKDLGRIFNLAVDLTPAGDLKVYSAYGECGKNLEKEYGQDYADIHKHMLQILARVINASWEDVKKLQKK